METLEGQVLGQYRVIEQLGKGGMATVFKALDLSLNRPVALKILPPELAHDDELVERFQHEGENAAGLRHPHIVTIYQVGEANGYRYIAMEYLAGSTLKSLIRGSGSLSLERTVRILRQVAEALDYAHARGFVHRDVKPSNVMIGPDDHATLTDFGLAKAIEGTEMTRTGRLVGTPAYMSPEQARGEEVDARTDLYALGVVAYEMLTGRVPFDGSTAHSILHKVIYDRPPAMDRGPASTHAAVERALSKNPAQRFASAGELVQALQSSARWIRPQPRTIWAGAGVLLALVVMTAVVIALGNPQTLVAVQTEPGATRPAAAGPSGTPKAVPAVALPFADDFSRDRGWINATAGNFKLDAEQGKLKWRVNRSLEERFYIPIEPYAGDWTLEARFKVEAWANNCDFYLGLADDMVSESDGKHASGVFVSVGWFGEGIGNRVRPQITYSDRTDVVAWDTQNLGTYVKYKLDAWYRVVLTKQARNWMIILYDDTGEQVGEIKGTLPANHKPYTYIMLYNAKDGDWPTGSGLLDEISVTR